MQQHDLSGDENNELVRAIAEKRMVAATYNGMRLTLKPHLLFFRHGEPYLLANNAARQPPLDAKASLGQFKLAGLADIAMQDGRFVPIAGFDGRPPRDDDAVILAVTK